MSGGQIEAIPEPPVRHQQIIITLYGLYARQRESALPVSVLISMLGDLGYDAPGVRSSVSRLKAKGVLNSVRTEGVAGYAISPRALEIFTEGDERIFATERPNSGHDWVLAIFSVPESMRSKRHQLRSELQALGFGAMGSGVWIAPARGQPVAKRRLESRGLAGFVEFFHGDYATDADMRQKVAQWWDLGELDAQLREFLDVYAGAWTVGRRNWGTRRMLPWPQPLTRRCAPPSGTTSRCSRCGGAFRTATRVCRWICCRRAGRARSHSGFSWACTA